MKKRVITLVVVLSVIAVYFSYHSYETAIPVKVETPKRITCTITRSRIEGDHYSLRAHIKSYRSEQDYIKIYINTYDQHDHMSEYSTVYKIDKNIPFTFHTDEKEDIKKVVLRIALTDDFFSYISFKYLNALYSPSSFTSVVI